MKKVALLIVATGKYSQFVHNLMESIDEFFLDGYDVTLHIFTDNWVFLAIPEYSNRVFHNVPYKQWPYATLNRFHFFKQYEQQLQDADYLFYIDVDTLIKAPITSEILFDRVAVQHCGFINVRGSYETRPESTSYVAPNEGEFYFGGGFWGFSKAEFWKFINKAVEMIDTDAANGIIPVHNDESVLNRYLIDNPPTLILSPEYHYPQDHIDYYRKIWGGVDYECKILLLEKDAKEFPK